MTTDRRSVRRALAVASLAAALVAGAAPASALAAPSTPTSPPAGTLTPPGPHASLAAWKVAVNARIDVRLATLSALKIAVAGATNVTSAHRSTLTALLASDVSGLTALRTKADAETTVAAVRADGRTMVVDYRIYMLVVPKVRFTIAGDTEAAVITRLTSVHDTLSQVATKLAGQGKNTGPEQAEIADMASKLDAATTALNGTIDALLAVTPSPDPSAMRAAVSPVRDAVHTARNDIKTAIADARTARAGLKAL